MQQRHFFGQPHFARSSLHFSFTIPLWSNQVGGYSSHCARHRHGRRQRFESHASTTHTYCLYHLVTRLCGGCVAAAVVRRLYHIVVGCWQILKCVNTPNKHYFSIFVFGRKSHAHRDAIFFIGMLIRYSMFILVHPSDIIRTTRSGWESTQVTLAIAPVQTEKFC